MDDVHHIINRELLLDTKTRADYLREIDPLISIALASRGYLETLTPARIIELNGDTIQPSDEYNAFFDRARFSALSVTTTHDVMENERTLHSSSTLLKTVGGFTVATLITNPDEYAIKVVEYPNDSRSVTPERVDETVMSEILQDIRAYTELGYSASDTYPPVETVIEELSALHQSYSVERASTFLVGDGSTRINIGENFEIPRNQRGRKSINYKKVFDLISRIPFGNGSAMIGTRYISHPTQPEVKITAQIDANDYRPEELDFLYKSTVKKYQETDVNELRGNIMHHLCKVADPKSNTIRLG